MFTCFVGGRPHSHNLVHEARICAGLIQPPAPSAPVRMATPNQLKYIKNLGGYIGPNESVTFDRASSMIDNLKKNGPSVAPSASMPAPVKSDEDKRREMVGMLMQSVPSGYFATRLEEGAKTNFLRVSRPTRNRFATSIKVQTQHGDRLELAAAFWPSGKVSMYDSRVMDMLMLLVTDYQGCAMRYAQLIGKCCRCNAALTDERSRHYGIGPECEKVFRWVIDMVDEQHDGKSFEHLAR